MSFNEEQPQQTKKSYNLGTIRQLIDLNGNSVNFNIDFSVTCHNDISFDFLIVTQDMLDDDQELKYKKINKTISGNIIGDKNIYKNYYILLRADSPCIVDVVITKKDLPKKEEITPNENVSYPSLPAKLNWTKIIMIGSIIVVIGIVAVYLYNQRKKPKKEGFLFSNDSSTLSSQHSSPCKPSYQPTVMEQSDVVSSSCSNTLLDRLKKIAV